MRCYSLLSPDADALVLRFEAFPGFEDLRVYDCVILVVLN